MMSWISGTLVGQDILSDLDNIYNHLHIYDIYMYIGKIKTNSLVYILVKK